MTRAAGTIALFTVVWCMSVPAQKADQNAAVPQIIWMRESGREQATRINIDDIRVIILDRNILRGWVEVEDYVNFIPTSDRTQQGYLRQLAVGSTDWVEGVGIHPATKKPDFKNYRIYTRLSKIVSVMGMKSQSAETGEYFMLFIKGMKIENNDSYLTVATASELTKLKRYVSWVDRPPS